MVVGRQPNAPAAFTPRKIPGTNFQRLSRPQGTRFCRKEPRKKSPVTPLGIDAGTVRLVAQRLNHYATPGPLYLYLYLYRTVTWQPSTRCIIQKASPYCFAVFNGKTLFVLPRMCFCRSLDEQGRLLVDALRFPRIESPWSATEPFYASPVQVYILDLLYCYISVSLQRRPSCYSGISWK